MSVSSFLLLTSKKGEKMNKSDETKVIVLGGLGEVGRNMYCVMHKDEIIILDAGVSFAGDLLGIDYVLPDYSF